jgi:hypothetical protein
VVKRAFSAARSPPRGVNVHALVPPRIMCVFSRKIQNVIDYRQPCPTSVGKVAGDHNLYLIMSRVQIGNVKIETGKGNNFPNNLPCLLFQHVRLSDDSPS